MNNPLHFLILALATWRLSSLLATEDGPYAVFATFRDFVGVSYGEYSNLHTKNEFAAWVACVWCSSVGIGATWAGFYYLTPPQAVWVALPFAISTVAVIIEEFRPG